MNQEAANKALRKVLLELSRIAPGQFKQLESKHFVAEDDCFTRKIKISPPYESDLYVGTHPVWKVTNSCVEMYYNNTPEGTEWFSQVTMVAANLGLIKHSVQPSMRHEGYDNLVTFQAILGSVDK